LWPGDQSQTTICATPPVFPALGQRLPISYD
jgi:hypothetical protein